ncbi:hypothetical protein FQR65_LT02291 [Abscondita terminalis]|nr:hypothetical protein FQR65_LT02291 [Abscondita terminalis]
MSQDKVLITNEVQLFFEKFLRKFNIYNYAIDLVPGCNLGDSYSGIVTKVKVGGEDGEKKEISQSFFIKSAPQSEKYRKVFLTDFTFSREIHIYKTVLCEFAVLQTELKVKMPFKSYPKYYDSSTVTLNEALVLEDMNEHGFVLHRGRQLLNFEYSVNILKEYAKLHALSFAMRLHKPNIFKELTESMEEGFFLIFERTNKDSCYVRQGKKVLLIIDQVKEKSLYEKFENFVTNMSDLIQSLLKSNLANPHGVVNHGDCWLKNYMFKYNDCLESGGPVDVCMLDWQLSHYGSPALDLAYFIFSCTEKELRDKYYSILIEEYYSMFSSTLTEMGGNPQQQFSFETLQEHLKKYSVFGLYTALMSLLVTGNDSSEVSNSRDVIESDQLLELVKKIIDPEYFVESDEEIKEPMKKYVSYKNDESYFSSKSLVYKDSESELEMETDEDGDDENESLGLGESDEEDEDVDLENESERIEDMEEKHPLITDLDDKIGEESNQENAKNQKPNNKKNGVPVDSAYDSESGASNSKSDDDTPSDYDVMKEMQKGKANQKKESDGFEVFEQYEFARLVCARLRATHAASCTEFSLTSPDKMSRDTKLISNEVQHFFEDFLKKLKINNVTINVVPGSNFGDNFVGMIAKVKVDGDNEQEKEISQSFIIKSAPQDENYRNLFPVDFLFTREIHIYKTVLNEFTILQTELNIKLPFKSYPKYYDSSMEYLNEALILEDMNEIGFKICNSRQLLNFEHSVMVLREYAKLHALSFAMRLHKPKLFKKITEDMKEAYFPILERTHKDNLFLKQAKKILLTIDQVKEKSIYEKFQNFVTNMSNMVQNFLKSNLTDPHGVINHGDCWLKNFMFKYNSCLESRAPVDVCILDWQLSYYGSPTLDLAYFMFSCTEKELRDKHYSFLMEDYYNTFSSTLTEMGGNPQLQFPFQIFHEHLKKYSVFGLYTALMALLVVSNENSEVFDFKDISKTVEFAERIKKIDSDEYLYNRRIKGVIIDIDRLGYNFY